MTGSRCILREPVRSHKGRFECGLLCNMRLPWLVLLLIPLCSSQRLAIEPAPLTEYCKATDYSHPGFRSERSLFATDSTLWDDVRKVAFQNKDGTWLAGHLRDTGSDFIQVLFGGSTTHKETWPVPDLARTLAQQHGLSSLAVDIAGRGESCGYEIGPDCSGQVNEPNGKCQLYSLSLDCINILIVCSW